jgi:hypothetical protein
MSIEDYNRFGYNFYKKKGFNIKILILGKVYDKHFLLYKKFKQISDKDTLIFKDIRSLENFFLRNKESIYLDFFIGNSSWNYKSLRIYHLINKLKLRLVLPISSFTPTQSKKNISIIKFIKNTNFKNNYFLEFISRKLIYILRKIGFYKNIYEVIFSIKNKEILNFKKSFNLSCNICDYSTIVQDQNINSKKFKFKNKQLNRK